MAQSKFLLIEANASTLGNTFNALNSTNHVIEVYTNDGGTLVYTLQIGDNKTFTVVVNTEIIEGTPTLVYSWDITEHIPKATTLSYSIDRECWQGQNDIKAVDMTYDEQETYTIKGFQVYKQDSETQLLNGVAISGELIGICNVKPYFEKEFIAISVNSNVKPTSIEFADNVDNLPLCELSADLPIAGNSIYYLKNYGGRFTNKIPRKTYTTSNPNTNRMQGKVLVYKITYNENEHFAVSDCLINFDELRLQI